MFLGEIFFFFFYCWQFFHSDKEGDFFSFFALENGNHEVVLLLYCKIPTKVTWLQTVVYVVVLCWINSCDINDNPAVAEKRVYWKIREQIWRNYILVGNFIFLYIIIYFFPFKKNYLLLCFTAHKMYSSFLNISLCSWMEVLF